MFRMFKLSVTGRRIKTTIRACIQFMEGSYHVISDVVRWSGGGGQSGL